MDSNTSTESSSNLNTDSNNNYNYANNESAEGASSGDKQVGGTSSTSRMIPMQTTNSEIQPKRGPGRPRKYPQQTLSSYESNTSLKTVQTPPVSSNYYDPKIDKYIMKQKVKKYVQHYLDKYSHRLYSDAQLQYQPRQSGFTAQRNHLDYEDGVGNNQYDDDYEADHPTTTTSSGTQDHSSTGSVAHQVPMPTASAPTTNSKLDQIMGRQRRLR